MNLRRSVWKKIGILCYVVMVIVVLSPIPVFARNKISVSVDAKRAIITDMETEEVLYVNISGKSVRMPVRPSC